MRTEVKTLVSVLEVELKLSNVNERESYVKHNSRMLVQGNVGRVKKLGVVIGKSGRVSNIITLRNHNCRIYCNSPLHNSPFSRGPVFLPNQPIAACWFNNYTQL